MATLIDLGGRLRAARLTEGLSQAQVGEKLHVTGATISNWESGKTKPSDTELKKLQRILGNFDAVSNRSTRSGNGDDERPSAFGIWLRKSRDKAGLSVNELAERASVSVPTIYFLEGGRTQLPLEQTRRRLEAALKVEIPEEVTREAAAEQQIEGLGSLTDFDPYDSDDRPKLSGVYVFYDISDRPIYVGQSKNIANRVNSHSDKFWFKRPIVERAAFIEIKPATLRSQIEQILIKFLKSNAVLNKQGVDRDDDE
jgi:transcriptional regulator with XRE-family HTH domain